MMTLLNAVIIAPSLSTVSLLPSTAAAAAATAATTTTTRARIWIRSLTTTPAASTTASIGVHHVRGVVAPDDADVNYDNNHTNNSSWRLLEPCLFGRSMFDQLLQHDVVCSDSLNSNNNPPQLHPTTTAANNDHYCHYDRQLVSLLEKTTGKTEAATAAAAESSTTTTTSSTTRSKEGRPPPNNDYYRVVLESCWEEEDHDVVDDGPQKKKSHHDDYYHSSLFLPMGRARANPAWGSTACPTTVKNKPPSPPTTPATVTTTTSTPTKPPPPQQQRPPQPPPRQKKKKLYPQLAVVGLVLDPSGQYVLLTRRPSYMRSFPGAWVLPGGGFDATTDTSLQQVLEREVKEETGLSLRQVQEEVVRQQQHKNMDFKSTSASANNDDDYDPQPICIWESVYPTDPEDPGPIQAHHLVVFLRAFVQQQTSPSQLPQQRGKEKDRGESTSDDLPTLKLQASEVDGALWLSVSDFCQVLERMKELGQQQPMMIQREESSRVALPPPLKKSVTVHCADGTMIESTLDTIVGIYPQPDPHYNNNHNHHQQEQQRQQQKWCGIAQGSLFALEELLLLRRRMEKISDGSSSSSNNNDERTTLSTTTTWVAMTTPATTTRPVV